MKKSLLCLGILIAFWDFPSYYVFLNLATKRTYRFPGAEIGRIFSALFPIFFLMMHSNILLTFLLTTAVHWVSISSAWARMLHLNASLNLKLHTNEPHHLSHFPSCICTFVLPITTQNSWAYVCLLLTLLLSPDLSTFSFWVPSKPTLFIPIAKLPVHPSINSKGYLVLQYVKYCAGVRSQKWSELQCLSSRSWVRQDDTHLLKNRITGIPHVHRVPVAMLTRRCY